MKRIQDSEIDDDGIVIDFGTDLKDNEKDAQNADNM
jgi:hypothetical protein